MGLLQHPQNLADLCRTVLLADLAQAHRFRQEVSEADRQLVHELVELGAGGLSASDGTDDLLEVGHFVGLAVGGH